MDTVHERKGGQTLSLSVCLLEAECGSHDSLAPPVSYCRPSGCAVPGPPGNTLASLRRAVEAGAQMLEVDVRRTRDDVLVLDHDNVHLLDGEEVPLRDRSFSQWRTHGGDWGEALTTLDEAIALASEAEVGLMLDFKEPGTEGLLARAVRRSGFRWSPC